MESYTSPSPGASPESSKRNADYLTAESVADMLGVSKRLILEMWRAGRLPGIKVGRRTIRFPRRDVEQTLDAMTEGKAGRR